MFKKEFLPIVAPPSSLDDLPQPYYIPWILYPTNEETAHYYLASILRVNGYDIACEFELDNGKIDIIASNNKRLVGIEVKRGKSYRIEKQMKKYRKSRKIGELYIAYLVKKAYNKFVGEGHIIFDSSGHIEVGESLKSQWYGKIDKSVKTAIGDYLRNEATFKSYLWAELKTKFPIVATETKLAPPQSRRWNESPQTYLRNKTTRRSDLAIGTNYKENGLPDDIWGIEAKVQLKHKGRVLKQLQDYWNSKLFSKVFLAVPTSLKEKAKDLLKEDNKTGLITFEPNQSPGIDIVRKSSKKEDIDYFALQKWGLESVDEGFPYYYPTDEWKRPVIM